MPFIDMGLDQAEARVLVEEGSHHVRIKAVKTKDSKNIPEQVNVNVLLEFPDFPNAKNMFHTIAGIGPEDDEEKVNNKRLMAIAFLDTFDVDWSEGFEMDDLIDREAEVRIGVEEGEDGVTRNRINLDW